MPLCRIQVGLSIWEMWAKLASFLPRQTSFLAGHSHLRILHRCRCRWTSRQFVPTLVALRIKIDRWQILKYIFSTFLRAAQAWSSIYRQPYLCLWDTNRWSHFSNLPTVPWTKLLSGSNIIVLCFIICTQVFLGSVLRYMNNLLSLYVERQLWPILAWQIGLLYLNISLNQIMNCQTVISCS